MPRAERQLVHNIPPFDLLHCFLRMGPRTGTQVGWRVPFEIIQAHALRKLTSPASLQRHLCQLHAWNVHFKNATSHCLTCFCLHYDHAWMHFLAPEHDSPLQAPLTTCKLNTMHACSNLWHADRLSPSCRLTQMVRTVSKNVMCLVSNIS